MHNRHQFYMWVSGAINIKDYTDGSEALQVADGWRLVERRCRRVTALATGTQ